MLLAEPHPGLAEGIRLLLGTTFDTVVMVADEYSLVEVAGLLQAQLAVVAMPVARGRLGAMMRRLADCCPNLKVLVLSVEEGPEVTRSVIASGANGFLVKRAIASDLLAAVDTVMRGECYTLPPDHPHAPEAAPAA